jgi:transposase
MDKRVTSGRVRRRKHDEALKRELVARSLQPGASVAAIAQDNGINANLLFNWRRLHLRSGAVVAAASSPPGPVLLPVMVQEPMATTATTAATRTAGALTRMPSGVIEIDIGSARVRVRGVVDEATVRCVLHALGSIA